MFAGVTASSMPTVKQFCTRQNFSLTSWTSSLKIRFTRLRSSPATVKLPDHDPSFPDWGGSDRGIRGDDERFRMRDLESDGCERKAAKASRVEAPRIHLTQDISVI